jgi:phenylacetate-CoA ligase
MYAQEEMSIHASDCRLRCGMHIAPWHSIVETDPKGKMISTSLFKRAYPFLRFDTQDYSKITTKKCSCGRTSPRIIHIIGREGGMLISREGATFGTSTIYKMLSSREFRIKNMNFVQNNKGEVLIFIDTRDPEKKEIERMVKNRLKHLFSINVHFKKRYTNATKKNLSIRSSLRA